MELNNYKKTIGILFEKTIGDLIYTSSIVASIRKNEPEAFIHIVTSNTGMEVLKSDKPDYNTISTKFNLIHSYDVIYQPLKCAQFTPEWFKYGIHIRDLAAKSIGIDLSVTTSNIINPKEEQVSEECREIKNSRYIIISNRASGDRLKELPLSVLNEVIKKISMDFPTFQLGLAQDPPLASVTNNLLGSTTLTEALYLIKNAYMVVSIDNFIAHAAGAYKRPLLGIYGQYDYNQVKPIDDTTSEIINKGINGQYNFDGCNKVTADEIYDSYLRLKGRIE